MNFFLFPGRGGQSRLLAARHFASARARVFHERGRLEVARFPRFRLGADAGRLLGKVVQI